MAKSTYETRRVIVTDGLGVTEGFQYRIRLHDLIFQTPLNKIGNTNEDTQVDMVELYWIDTYFFLVVGSLLFFCTRTDGGEVRDYFFRILRLTSSRFTTTIYERLFSPARILFTMSTAY